MHCAVISDGKHEFCNAGPVVISNTIDNLPTLLAPVETRRSTATKILMLPFRRHQAAVIAGSRGQDDELYRNFTVDRSRNGGTTRGVATRIVTPRL